MVVAAGLFTLMDAGMKLLSTPGRPKRLPDVPHQFRVTDEMPAAWNTLA